MTRAEHIEVYERWIQYEVNEIEWCNQEAEWLNGQIARSRKKDAELVEYIWSKGVVDKYDMEKYTKGFESHDTKKLLKERAYNYRQRTKARRNLAEYTKIVEELKERC